MERLLKSHEDLLVIVITSDLIYCFLNCVLNRVEVILILALLRIIASLLNLRINSFILACFYLTLGLRYLSKLRANAIHLVFIKFLSWKFCLTWRREFCLLRVYIIEALVSLLTDVTERLVDQLWDFFNPLRLFWNGLVSFEAGDDRDIEDKSSIQWRLKPLCKLLDRLIQIFDIRDVALLELPNEVLTVIVSFFGLFFCAKCQVNIVNSLKLITEEIFGLVP